MPFLITPQRWAEIASRAFNLRPGTDALARKQHNIATRIDPYHADRTNTRLVKKGDTWTHQTKENGAFVPTSSVGGESTGGEGGAPEANAKTVDF